MKPVILITGASSGIGAELAKTYAKKGAHLILCARRLERLKEVKQACQSLSPASQIHLFELDVTAESGWSTLTETIRREFGRLDVVIANAGTGVGGNFEELEISDYRRQFETNVFGVLKTINATLDLLKESRGRLALVGSVNSYLSLPSVSAYCMSKFAVRGLAEALGPELQPYEVSVTLICPGFVKSEIRHTDKEGVYHPHSKDYAPSFLVMNTAKAARHIQRAIDRRKKEAVITFHGKVMVFLVRHFPGLISRLTPFALQKPQKA